MAEDPTPIKAGDVVIIEVTVVKVQDDSLIVKMPNGSHNVYKPEQVTKKP